MANVQYARMVYISANISFLTQESDECVERWIDTVVKEIGDQKPSFAALHMQGLYGIENDSVFLDKLTRAISRHPDLPMFDAVREIYDLDSLGICSIYFADRTADAMVFDYSRNRYVTLKGNYSDSYLRSDHVDHERLGMADGKPVGFMMTRWLLYDQPFDFVNLVLNGEVSLMDACIKWPSNAADKRRMYMNQILDKLSTYMHEDAILFAGNFNASINTSQLVQDQLRVHKARLQENHGLNVMDAFDLFDRKMFTINDKEFNFYDIHDWLFGTCSGQLIRKYDTELKEMIEGRLYEPTVFFPPTDSYAPSGRQETLRFSTTNSPGWRSRILMNDRMKDRIQHDAFSSSSLYYGLVGEAQYISKSKPVTLIGTFWIK